MSFEFFQHFRHGEKNGKPFVHLPWFVDSHADEKDHELAFHFGRHTANYLRHGTSSCTGFPIWGPKLSKNSIRLRSLGKTCCTRAHHSHAFAAPHHNREVASLVTIMRPGPCYE